MSAAFDEKLQSAMNDLFEEKMKVVLNLIRTNSTADDAMKITQASQNLANARNAFLLSNPETTESKTTKKSGAGA